MGDSLSFVTMGEKSSERFQMSLCIVWIMLSPTMAVRHSQSAVPPSDRGITWVKGWDPKRGRLFNEQGFANSIAKAGGVRGQKNGSVPMGDVLLCATCVHCCAPRKASNCFRRAMRAFGSGMSKAFHMLKRLKKVKGGKDPDKIKSPRYPPVCTRCGACPDLVFQEPSLQYLSGTSRSLSRRGKA